MGKRWPGGYVRAYVSVRKGAREIGRELRSRGVLVRE